MFGVSTTGYRPGEATPQRFASKAKPQEDTVPLDTASVFGPRAASLQAAHQDATHTLMRASMLVKRGIGPAFWYPPPANGHDSAKAFAIRLRPVREGDSIVYSATLRRRCNGFVADGRCTFRPHLHHCGIAGQGRLRRLRGCRRRLPGIAGRAVERRAVTRPVLCRKAVRRRVDADRPRWTGRV